MKKPGPIRRFFRFFGRLTVYLFTFLFLLMLLSRFLGSSNRERRF